jgi:uncharacterized phiE125 gp8 family phage protein
VRYSIRTVTPAAFDPVSIEDAKAHLGVTWDEQDAIITAYLRAAAAHVERYTSHVLADALFEIAWAGFPSFPELLTIPREPVTGIVSIGYDDGDGNAVAMAEADWRWSDTLADQVLPAFRSSWPSSSGEAGSVRLQFRAGYGEGLLPPDLAAAVLLMTGHLFRNREQVVVGSTAAELAMGVTALCAPYRRIPL